MIIYLTVFEIRLDIERRKLYGHLRKVQVGSLKSIPFETGFEFPQVEPLNLNGRRQRQRERMHRFKRENRVNLAASPSTTWK